MQLLTDSLTLKTDQENLENYSWQKVATRLLLEFGEEIYHRWLAKIEIASISSHEIILSVPSKFLRDWIKREYLYQGGNSGKGIFGVFNSEKLIENQNFQRISVVFAAKEENSSKNLADSSNFGQVISISKYDNLFSLGLELNPKFTFENFVVGKCNQLAYNLAKVISGAIKADFMSGDCNPLFLYGGVGLGKTHLAQAVAWHIKENYQDKRVIYLSAERFMNQFVEALRNKDVNQFKDRLRGVDVLVIDDLHFIMGKEGTQTELLNTLSSMVENNKKVVLVCDRCPGDLEGIDEKLKSRIASGMIVDFKVPDYETRLEILKSKAKLMAPDLEIDHQVLTLLASKITSNVRDLEGALKKMIANFLFTGEAINLKNAEILLKDLFRTVSNISTIESIQKQVASYFQIKISDLKSSNRARRFSRPRQMAMYLCKKLTSKSLPDIGREFGNKNHATIIHAVKKVEELMIEDREFVNDIRKIEEALS